MGEEKPEEELMGKCKSSPRLLATDFTHVAIFIIGKLVSLYTCVICF